MAARPGRRPANHESDDRGPRIANAGSDPDRRRRRHATALLDRDRAYDVERLLADYDSAMEQALAGLERAFVEAHGSWEDRMTAAIGHLLGLAAANPELARLCTTGILEAGQRGLEHRDRWMDRFMRLCSAGYELAGADDGVPTRLLPQVAAGAVFELIRVHVDEDRLSELPAALPTARLVALAPVVGTGPQRH